MNSTMMVRRTRQLLAFAAVAIFAACHVGAVSAQQFSWLGNTSANWNTGANWNNGVPVSGITTTLTFTNAGTAGSVLNNDITGLTLSTIIINRSAMTSTTNYQLNGNSITVANNGFISLTGLGVTAGNMTATIGMNIFTAGNMSFNVSGSQNFLGVTGNISTTATSGTSIITLTNTATGTQAANISGAITDGGFGGIIAVQKQTSAGNWTLSGANNFTGGVTVFGGSLTLTGAGQTIGGGITLLSGSATLGTTIGLSGGVNVFGGVALNVTNSQALGSQGTLSTITTGSGAVTTTIQFSAAGGAYTLNRTINLSGTTAGLVVLNNAATTNTITLQGTIAPVSGSLDMKTLTLTGSNVNINEIQSTIGTAGTFTNVSIVKAGPGGWYLSGASPFVGSISVSNGALYFNSVSNDGTTASALGVGNSINLGNGTTTGLISYSGAASAAISGRAINLGSGSTGGGGISNTSAAASSTLLISGNVINSAGVKTLFLGGQNTGVNDIQSTLTNGAGTLGVQKIDAGTWQISGANTYGGGFTLQAGTVIINHDSALGTGTVTLTTGTFITLASRTFTNSLFLDGGITFSNAAGVNTTFSNAGGSIFVQAATTLTNRNVDGAASLAFFNNFVLQNSLTFTGPAAFTLTGDITVSGASRTLVVSNAGGQTLNNIALSAVTDLTTARTMTLQGNTPITISGAISTGPTATLAGVSTTGFVTFNNANTYNGGTTLLAGTLTQNNAGGFGTGGVTFAGGSLATTGSLTFTNSAVLLGTAGFTGVNTITMNGSITVSAATRQISNTNTATTFLAGSIVLGDTGGARTLTLGGSATSTGVISGTISDGPLAGGQLAVATGNWIISGSNSFTGTTSITGGSLAIDNANALGSGHFAITGGTVLAGPSGAVTITNIVDLLGNVSISGGSNPLTLSGVVNVTAARTISALGNQANVINSIVASPTPTTFALTFSGNGNLIVNSLSQPTTTTNVAVVVSTTGGGTLIYAGATSYTGVTTVGGAGRLQLGNGGAAGMLLGNIALTTGTGGTVIFNRSDLAVFSPIISGSGTVVVNSPATGGVSFTTVQTFAGNVSLNAGTLQYGIANAINTANTFLVNSTGTLNLNGFAGGITTLSDVSGTGGTITSGVAGGVLTITQGFFSGTIGGGANLAVQKGNLAAGILTLSGNNAFSGTSTLAGGTLYVGTNSALGTGTWYIGAGSIGGTGGTRTISNNLIVSGAATITTGADLNLTSTASLSSAVTTFTIANTAFTTTFANLVLVQTNTQSATTVINVADNASVVFGGVISSGSGTRALITLSGSAAGSGAVVRMTAANTYTGATTIGNNITLVLEGAGRLASNNAVNMTNSSVLSLSGSFTQTLASLASLTTAAVVTQSAAGATGILSLTGGTFAGVIKDGAGTMSVVVNTAGSVSFTNDNTYTGVTTIRSGTLTLGNGGATGSILGNIVLSQTAGIVMNRNNAVTYTGNITRSNGTGVSTGGLTVQGGGQFTLNGTIQYGGGTTVGANTSLTLGAGTALTVTSGAITVGSGGNLTFLTGATIGTGAITVTTNASLIFDGTQSGPTGGSAINLGSNASLAGVGQLTGSANIAVNNDVYIGRNGDLAGGSTLTIGQIVLNGGSLNYDWGALTETLRVQTGTSSIAAASTININILSGFTPGTYTLIAGYSGLISNTNLLSINLIGGSFTKTLISDTGNLQLQLSAVATRTWDGAINNVWDVQTTTNFSGSTFTQGEGVVFTDTTTTSDVLLSNASGTLAPNSILVNNSSVTYTFSGDAIGGDTGITKQGTGVLTLLNDNTFTGGLNISGGGTVRFGSGSSTSGGIASSVAVNFDNSSNLIVDRNNTVSFTGSITGSGNLIQAGSGTTQMFGISAYTGTTTVSGGTLASSGTGVLAGMSTYIVTTNGTLAIDGTTAQVIQSNVVIGGGVLNVNTAGLTTSTLIVLAGGTVNLNNALTPATFSLNNGTLNVNVNNTISTLTNLGGGGAGSTSIVNIAGGQTLTIAANLNYSNGGNPNGAIISGPGILSLSVTSGVQRTITVNDSSAADNDLTISAQLSGSSQFLKAGNGTLYLTNANTMQGANVLNAGTLKIGNAGALGAGALVVTGTSLSTTRAIISADGTARSVTNDIQLNGSTAIGGTQNLTFSGNMITMSANRRITFEMTNNAVATIQNIILSQTTGSAFIFVAGGSGNVVINNISDTVGGTVFGGFQMNLSPGLTVTLANANSYGGPTTIAEGTVFLGNIGSLGTTTAAVNVAQVGNAAINTSLLTISGITITRNMTVLANTSATSVITFGGATTDSSAFTGNINFSSTAGIYLSAVSSGTAVFGGSLSNGTITTGGITKTGAGVVILSGANTFTNGVTIANGTLRLGASGTLPSQTRLVVAAAGTLDLNGFNASATTLTDGTGGGGSITSGTSGSVLSASNGTFGGVISGSLDLVKLSTGSLILTNDNTFAGITTISAGTLQLGNGGSSGNLTGGGNIVNSGTLAINRSGSMSLASLISGPGALTVTSGGTVTLSADNTYTGATTVTGGVLRLAGSNASSTISLGTNTMEFFTNSSQTISGVIAGNGFLNKLGTGTTYLTGVSTFNGNTTVGAGVLDIANAMSGTIHVNAGGTLSGAGVNASTVNVNGGVANLTGVQTGVLNILSGTTTLSGVNLNGTVSVSGGVLTLTNSTITGTTYSQTGGVANLNAGSSVNGALTLSGGTFNVNAGSTTVTAVNINGGTFAVGNGVTLSTGVTAVGLNAGTLLINSGATFETGGTFTFSGGTLNVSGTANGNLHVLNGATLKGGHYDFGSNTLVSGVINGTVTVDEGGVLSIGSSVGDVSMSNLSLTHGSILNFEFRNATGTTPGQDWDHIDLGATGVLDLGDATANNRITINIDSWMLDNLMHGGAVTDGTNFNNFNPQSTYDWLFIEVASLTNLTTNGNDDNFSRRFNILDSVSGSGVFGSGNPFTRPMSGAGQGTFTALWKTGTQGSGLYIHYSAIPEPGSMILAGLASMGAGWYGRRRMRGQKAKQQNADQSGVEPKSDVTNA